MSNKLNQVAVRLESDLLARLQAQAEADQRPLASMIRKILRNATVITAPTDTQQGTAA